MQLSARVADATYSRATISSCVVATDRNSPYFGRFGVCRGILARQAAFARAGGRAGSRRGGSHYCGNIFSDDYPSRHAHGNRGGWGVAPHTTWCAVLSMAGASENRLAGPRREVGVRERRDMDQPSSIQGLFEGRVVHPQQDAGASPYQLHWFSAGAAEGFTVGLRKQRRETIRYPARLPRLASVVL